MIQPTFSEKSARTLAAKIVKHWQKIGKTLSIWVEPVPGLATTWQVRSDMLNGFPR